MAVRVVISLTWPATVTADDRLAGGGFFEKRGLVGTMDDLRSW